VIFISGGSDVLIDIR